MDKIRIYDWNGEVFSKALFFILTSTRSLWAVSHEESHFSWKCKCKPHWFHQRGWKWLPPAEIWQFFWLVFMSDEPCKCYRWLCTVMFAKRPQASQTLLESSSVLSAKELSVITGKIATASHHRPYRIRRKACHVFYN